MRPLMRVKDTKIEREIYFNLKNYLQEPGDQELDDEGNTSLH
jgi:hypothetical protein